MSNEITRQVSHSTTPSHEMTSAIEMIDLSKTFGTLRAVDHLSLGKTRGDFRAVGTKRLWQDDDHRYAQWAEHIDGMAFP
jgi:hypothetical protein